MKDKQARDEIVKTQEVVKKLASELGMEATFPPYLTHAVYDYIGPRGNWFAKYDDLRELRRDFARLLDYLGVESFEGKEFRKKKKVK